MTHSGNSVCGYYGSTQFDDEKEPTENMRWYLLWEKAHEKVKAIRTSQSFKYTCFGGGIARKRDIEFAQEVEYRILDYLYNKFNIKDIIDLWY